MGGPYSKSLVVCSIGVRYKQALVSLQVRVCGAKQQQIFTSRRTGEIEPILADRT